MQSTGTTQESDDISLLWKKRKNLRGNVGEVLVKKSVKGTLAYASEESFKSYAIPVCLNLESLNLV